MSITKPHFKLSSTAMGSTPCTLKLWRQVIQGYREKEMPSRIVYGIAVHKFVDVMYQTGDMGLAIAKAKEAFSLPKVDDKRSSHLSDERHMLCTCINLWTGFIAQDESFELLQVGGKPLTEVTFSIPFYKDDFIEVFLEGTIDKLGQFKGGCFAVGDWKFTSSWDNVGYFEQFELSRQLRMYRLATILEARNNPDSTLGRIGATKCGVFIDGVFLKPDANAMVAKRSAVHMLGEKDMKEFEWMLYEYCVALSLKVQKVMSRGEPLQFDKEGTMNGSCEGKWGKCSFWNVCKSPDNVAAVLLNRDFDIKPWNPSDYNNLGEV